MASCSIAEVAEDFDDKVTVVEKVLGLETLDIDSQRDMDQFDEDVVVTDSDKDY